MRVQERLTDALGRLWFHNYKAVSEAAATVLMNARDMTSRLEDADFKELLAWVQEKNDPDDFDFTGRDLTLLVGEERLYAYIAETRGDPAITIAHWLEGLNPPSRTAIRNRLPGAGGSGGVSVADGSVIEDRAIALNNAEPSFNTIVKVT